VKRTPEQRVESLAAKRAAPIAPSIKGEKIDMRSLPIAPPAPRVREHLGMRNGLKTYTRLGMNVERQAAGRMETHGPHAAWVATLPCCVCMPEHYHGPTLKPFMYNPDNRDSRISDPHHVRTRGGGGSAETCVPLCRLHHSQLGAPGWGHDTFEATYAVDLFRVAALLWDQSPERDK
jgi:hypothetical protein